MSGGDLSFDTFESRSRTIAAAVLGLHGCMLINLLRHNLDFLIMP